MDFTVFAFTFEQLDNPAPPLISKQYVHLKFTCMFNHTFRHICSFFTPGKKSIFSATDQENMVKQPGRDADKTNVRVLYHRDFEHIQTIETKPESLQHDWWIN